MASDWLFEKMTWTFVDDASWLGKIFCWRGSFKQEDNFLQ